MLFVGQGTFKESSDRQERRAPRLNWDYPEDVNVISEYWLQSDRTQVITIFEVEDIAPIMQMQADWESHISFNVSPAVSVQDGMQALRQFAAEMTAV